MQVPFAPSDELCGACREQARQDALQAANRKRAKSLEQRLLDAGAPRKFSTCTKGRWESQHGKWQERGDLRRLVGWPHNREEDSWLLFILRTEVDDLKTELATAVLGEALSQADVSQADVSQADVSQADVSRADVQPICWTSQSAWLRQLKASWNAHASRNTPGAVAPEHVVWQRVAQASVLLFDEFGGLGGGLQFEKPWWRSQISQLIHHRERHRLPTIITARYADWRQVEKIDEALVTRMNVPLKISLD